MSDSTCSTEDSTTGVLWDNTPKDKTGDKSSAKVWGVDDLFPSDVQSLKPTPGLVAAKLGTAAVS